MRSSHGYSVNSFNFEAGYPILFPRAIEYSAGLINYIFRGRLKLESFVESGSTVEIVIRNDSAAGFGMFGGQENGVEEFSLYYDTQDGTRRRIALPNGEISNSSIGNGMARTFQFSLPADVNRTKDKPFLLVFNGRIGTDTKSAERGIAALAIGSQNSALVVTPNYPVSDGISGQRAIEDVGGTWQANSRGTQAGNVDWRGHGPDDVLTWDGPSSRFFGLGLASHNIYQGGKVLTTAPEPVIGAAIYKVGSARYLLAAVISDVRFKIYRRPYQRSYRKNGMYDALNNPTGWVLLHTEPAPATSPMFFNASGTEAQVFSGRTTRYKINISGSNVSSVALSNIGSFKRAGTNTSDRSVSVEANPGPPQSCQANGSNCLSRGECYGNPNTCMISQAGETVSSNYIVNVKHTTENVASTVVCADYKGDQEVLCRVEADESPSAGSMSNVGRFTQSRTVTMATCNDTVVTGETEFEHRIRHLDDSRDLMVLRVGAKTIPLTGSTRRYDSEARSHVYRPLGLNLEPVVDFTYQFLQTAYDTKILYMDARNDIVVYEDHTKVEDNLGSGTVDVQPPISFTSEYWFAAPFQSEVTTTHRTIVSAREDHVVSSAIDREPTRQLVTHLNAGFKTVEPQSCMSQRPVTTTFENVFEWDLKQFYEQLLHTKINDTTQSLSAISNSKFVASWPRWVRQADNTYRQDGTWNYLSDGDLTTLLPGATSTAKYAPTGLIR